MDTPTVHTPQLSSICPDVMVYLESRAAATVAAPMSLSFDILLTCVQHLAPDLAIPSISTSWNVLELLFIKSPTLPPPLCPLFPFRPTSSLSLDCPHLIIRAPAAVPFVLICAVWWRRGQRQERRVSGEADKLIAVSNLTCWCCSGCASAALGWPLCSQQPHACTHVLSCT